jgi:hypothetical protein
LSGCFVNDIDGVGTMSDIMVAPIHALPQRLRDLVINAPQQDRVIEAPVTFTAEQRLAAFVRPCEP